ncbi:hypothetical protein IGI04_024571 [Brassica rapa subsp. trilocularis]|uniref:Uncharacterized protein n=1 Tax=Brassica rapa subsp. trilocularis TaxID=1813537 RepID=A0ABQ7M731_BRACM|nr:hypothetical protein IGI04_024571 [Brassica rapa subsp. trilocularis]
MQGNNQPDHRFPSRLFATDWFPSGRLNNQPTTLLPSTTRQYTAPLSTTHSSTKQPPSI